MKIRQFQLLITMFLAWFSAQFIKGVLYAIVNRDFRLERFVGNGGMPSSHASTVCSFATACLILYGLSSFEFAMTLIFAIVVLMDAMGVRLETGKQARMINAIFEENILNLKNIAPEHRLKEMVGHTPFQVLVGSALGILVALGVNAALK